MSRLKWIVLWTAVFVYFFARHKVADGFMGPIEVLFCAQDQCGVRGFSPRRLWNDVIHESDGTALSLVASLFLATTLTAVVWTLSARRRKRTNE